jgi:hypothetical protein
LKRIDVPILTNVQIVPMTVMTAKSVSIPKAASLAASRSVSGETAGPTAARVCVDSAQKAKFVIVASAEPKHVYPIARDELAVTMAVKVNAVAATRAMAAEMETVWSWIAPATLVDVL